MRSKYLIKIAKEQPDYAEGTASLTEKRPPTFPPSNGVRPRPERPEVVAGDAQTATCHATRGKAVKPGN